jgi:GcrA cell cycle regulator
MTFGQDSGWTDDRIEMLKRLAVDGLSASQIACELGGVTRNAVLGKLDRLGLRLMRSSGGRLPPGERARREAERKRAKRAERGAKPRRRRSLGEAKPERKLTRDERMAAVAERQDRFACEALPYMTDEQRARTVTLLDLGRGQCHWPLGDPQREDFRFCGGAAEPERPYCLDHCRIAYKAAA